MKFENKWLERNLKAMLIAILCFTLSFVSPIGKGLLNVIGYCCVLYQLYCIYAIREEFKNESNKDDVD